MTQHQLLATLVERRKRLGLNQSELAKIMGISSFAVSHLENDGREHPRVTTLIRYAAAVGLELTLKEVAGGNEVQLRDPDDSR